MKKERMKGFISGVVLMALVFSLSTSTLAASQKALLADYADIKIVVNGAEISPKDSTGNPVEPFIVDGTTYLPVRAIAEALGENVGWDANTKTVYIGTTPPTPPTTTTAAPATTTPTATSGAEGDNKLLVSDEYLSVKDYKKLCSKRTYTDLARYPKKYEGELIYTYGKVFQVFDNGTGTYTILVYASGNTKQTIYIHYNSNVLGEDYPIPANGDNITIYGLASGTMTYDTVSGAPRTAPYIVAAVLDVDGANARTSEKNKTTSTSSTLPENHYDIADAESALAKYESALAEYEKQLAAAEQRLANVEKYSNTKVLTKDENGNWQWEYVPDADALEEAQSEVDYYQSLVNTYQKLCDEQQAIIDSIK